MINKDCKDKPESYGTTCESERKPLVKRFIPSSFQGIFDTLHRYSFYMIIATAFGIYVGVKASNWYYTDSMNTAVSVGGMSFKGKPYTLIPK